MFRVENNVPDVYVNESRDFQLISRLYDLVFQSTRFSIDSMSKISDTIRCNDNLLPLIATKVGFFTDLNLTSKSDRMILSAFPYILKYKGSLKSVELTANLFGRIVNSHVDVRQDPEDKNHIILNFDKFSPNIDILYALLNYIRPTGIVIDFEMVTKDSVAIAYETSDEVNVTFFDTGNEVFKLDYKTDKIDKNDKTDKNDKYSTNIGFTLTTKEERIYVVEEEELK